MAELKEEGYNLTNIVQGVLADIRAYSDRLGGGYARPISGSPKVPSALPPSPSTYIALPPSPRQYGIKRKEEPTSDLLSGPAKIIAGGLGAIPEAVGRTVPLIPAGIGKLIGAVPETPYTGYGKSESLGLAGQGIEEVGRGVRQVGQRARRGIMDIFGLKEAPIREAPVTTPAPTAGFKRRDDVIRPSVAPPIISPPAVGTKARTTKKAAKLTVPAVETAPAPMPAPAVPATTTTPITFTPEMEDRWEKIQTAKDALQLRMQYVKSPAAVRKDEAEMESLNQQLIDLRYPGGWPEEKPIPGWTEKDVDIKIGGVWTNKAEWHRPGGVGMARGLAEENLRRAVTQGDAAGIKSAAETLHNIELGLGERIKAPAEVAEKIARARERGAIAKAREAELPYVGRMKEAEIRKVTVEVSKLGMDVEKIKNDIANTDLLSPRAVAELILEHSPIIETADEDTGKVIKHRDTATGARIIKALSKKSISDEAMNLISPPPVAEIEPPPGAKKGIYKGKRAYLLKGKYYDLTTGKEIW